MIVFENVTKKYGEKVVLDKINLSIEGGEFVSLVGPSGAGKTTLILALIGAEKIDKGSITVDGYEITAFKPAALQYYRRKIGVVFQDYRLLPKKTVWENVAFALEVCGASGEEIKKRVAEVLELTSLLEHQGKFPAQLSGGEGQRTAIARALIHNPRLLLADEPTGNLDPNHARQVIELLLEINRRGATVLLTTHNRDLVDYLKRRVVSLDQGRIISDRETAGYDLPEVGDLEILEIIEDLKS